ncbi:MAG: hypothetical protein ACM3XM_10115 [Mycobacterium leprae]
MKANLAEILYVSIVVVLIHIIGEAFGPYAEWGAVAALLLLAMHLTLWERRKRKETQKPGPP